MYLVDDETLKIVENGDVLIMTPERHVWLLHNVRHIPGFKRNLSSVGQLDNKGYIIIFMNGLWRIT